VLQLELPSVSKKMVGGSGGAPIRWKLNVVRRCLQRLRAFSMLTSRENSGSLRTNSRSPIWLSLPPLCTRPRRSFPVGQYDNLQAWFERVQALDAWKKSGSIP
jgi:hypothetical protein